MNLHLIQPRELYGPAERQAELHQAWDITSTRTPCPRCDTPAGAMQ